MYEDLALCLYIRARHTIRNQCNKFTAILAARRRAALPRRSELPKHCAERPHAAAYEIACDLQRIVDRNFVRPQNFAFEIDTIAELNAHVLGTLSCTFAAIESVLSRHPLLCNCAIVQLNPHVLGILSESPVQLCN